MSRQSDMCVVSNRERNRERNREPDIGRITFLHERPHHRRFRIGFLSVLWVCRKLKTGDITRTRGLGVEPFATILEIVAVRRHSCK